MTSTFLRFNGICGTHQHNLTSDVHTLVWNLMVAPWSIFNTTHILEKHLWRSCASFTFLCATHLPSIHRSRILLRHDIIIIALKFCGQIHELWNEDAIFWEVMVWENHPTWELLEDGVNIPSYIWKKHVVKYHHYHPTKTAGFIKFCFILYRVGSCSKAGDNLPRKNWTLLAVVMVTNHHS